MRACELALGERLARGITLAERAHVRHADGGAGVRRKRPCVAAGRSRGRSRGIRHIRGCAAWLSRIRFAAVAGAGVAAAVRR